MNNLELTLSPVPAEPWPGSLTTTHLATPPPQLLASATLAAPVASAVLGLALLGGSGRSRRLGMAALVTSSVAGLLRWQLKRAFTWQPPFEIEFDYGRLQIRRYAPQIQAETTIEDATWNEAMNQGFMRLAEYVSGGNVAQQRLPMTCPVLTSVTAARRRQVKTWKPPTVTDLNELSGPTSRSMALVMPDHLTLDELPAPQDERVRLNDVPERRMAVLSFRGGYAGDLPAQKRNELLFLLKCAGLKAASEVWFAAYDPPTTVPFLRRNEVLVEIDE